MSLPKMSSLVIHWEKVNSQLQVLLAYFVGAFGLVKVGWLKKEPSKKFAIKSMKKASIIQSKHVDHIENEKIILAKLDHPFSVSSKMESMCCF